MKTVVNEGLVKIKAESRKIVSKDMDVFYNPVMGLNRDISIILLNSVSKNKMQIADPLAASGVRSARFIKELSKGKIKNISMNDYDENAVKSIKNNLTLNKIRYKNDKKIIIKNMDANLFLLDSTGFDYIDVDPFGTPNPFLDAACKRIARDGILAVTATDTSALCGTFPSACARKYWAAPKKGVVMHEIGLRILIRKIQLIGAQYDKALAPIFSYSREHYMRVFLRSDKGKNKTDEILKQHGMLGDAGPLWLGKLWDNALCNTIYRNAIKNNTFNRNKELVRFLEIIKEESKIDSIGFYDLNDVAEKNKIRKLPKKVLLKDKIRASGYKASDTHFAGNGIRSDITMKELVEILRKPTHDN